jgi:hypothetical protein
VGYANLSAAATDLGISDASDTARLQTLDDEIARLIDLKTGRTFGGTAADVARVVRLPVSYGHDTLVLPFPIRSVASIVITGDAARTYTTTDYALAMPTELTGDYHAIRLINSSAWPYNNGRSTLTITGKWSADAPGGAVPSEIVAAATVLVTEEWRLRQSSPAGEIGPDGMMTRARNPWDFEIVKTAIDHYGAALSMASF